MTANEGHSFSADFSGYWGERRNGWEMHGIVFFRNVQEEFGADECADPCFEVDKSTGTITVLRDRISMTFEVWWRGRAPWDYLNVQLAKGLNYNGVREPKKEMAEWWCGGHCPGHLHIRVACAQGERFNVLNAPAHMQGSPAVFQLRLEAKPLETTIWLLNSQVSPNARS